MSDRPTPDPVVLAELLERVRAASGPDRSLDALLHVTLTNGGETGRYPSVEIWQEAALFNGWATPQVTGSLDAVMQMVGRLMPNWQWVLRNDPNGQYRANLYRQYDHPNDGDPCWPAWADTPSLALLTSLLTALLHRSEAVHAE